MFVYFNRPIYINFLVENNCKYTIKNTRNHNCYDFNISNNKQIIIMIVLTKCYAFFVFDLFLYI